MARKIRRQTRNPKAAAAMIDLIRSYAAGGAPATPLQSAIERSLARVDPDRRISKRLEENYLKIPDRIKAPVLGRLTPGQMAGASEASFRQILTPAIARILTDDVIAPPPVYSRDTLFTIDYTGLYCRDETDDRWGGDEPYVITVAIGIVGGVNVQRSEIHPLGDPDLHYGSVDSGDSMRGPFAACWSGTEAANGVSLVTTVMEHDAGDPRAHEEEVTTVVNAAAELLTYLGIPISESIQDLVVDGVLWLLGGGDDEVGTVVTTLSPDQLRIMASVPTQRLVERRKVIRPTFNFQFVEEEVIDNTGLDYHFVSRHRESGEYVVTYRVTANRAPIVRPVVQPGATISQDLLIQSR